MKPLLEVIENIPPLTLKLVDKQIQISSQIIDILKKKGWNKKDLSKASGLKGTYLSRVFSSEANMTLETLCKIELALGEDVVSINKFIGQDYDTNRN